MTEQQSIRDDIWDWFDDVHDITEGGCNTRGEALADRLLASPVIRRIQAEALREFAKELDHYIGTVLNAESASNLAHARATGIERGDR